MCIALNPLTPPAQFGRAELKLKSVARSCSARPNCVEDCCESNL